MNAAQVQSLCRACRKEQKSGISYVPVETPDLNGRCIADMIYELTDIMVSFDRQLPQVICPQCLAELRAAYSFRQKCIDSNTILSKLVPGLTGLDPDDGGGLLVVKTENCDLDQTDTDEDSLYELVEQSVEMTREKVSEAQKRRRKGPRTPVAKLPKTTKASPSPARATANKNKRPFVEIIRECMETDTVAYYCAIDKASRCRYSQDVMKLDTGNFIRHCRAQHPEEAARRGLVVIGEDTVVEPKKVKMTKKQKFDQNVMVAFVKLVAVHHLPVRCFEWDGFRLLMEPLTQTLDFIITSANVLDFAHTAVEHLMDRIRGEMRDKMISVKVDTGTLRGQHFLTVSVQFVQYQRIVMRVLGVIRVNKGQTAKQLSTKILHLLSQYSVLNEQVFAMIVGNEANMLALGGGLQKVFADTVSNVDEWIGDTSEEAVKVETLLDELSAELRGQFNAIRSAVCNLQQIISSVVSDFAAEIRRIQRFVKDVNDPKYQEFFEAKKATQPPLCCSTNQWTVLYDISRNIIQQEKFYVTLCRRYPELALDESDWKFLGDYCNAFRPFYEMMELVHGENPPPFSEFYMRWLLAIKDVRGKTGNRFSTLLVESLTRQLVLLKENMVYRAALCLDPRFMYLQSVVFTSEQRDEVQNYIVSIWNRIQNIQGMATDQPEPAEVKQEDKKDDMDDFLTEMFGGPSEGSSKAQPIPLTSSITPILQQLKSLEIEPRQTHTYDVWKHWLLRTESHPELFSVAMVVLSLPSNNVNLERAFSALVLSDRRDGLSETALEELLLVRLNRNLFDQVVVSVSDWKHVLGS